MEAKFLTPIQLWKDFNPIKEALDIAYVKSESNNGFVRKGFYYTLETAEDGKARIYAEIVSLDDDKKKPVLIVLGDLNRNINTQILEYAASFGYTAAGLDYSASGGEEELKTKYPPSMEFAEYKHAVKNLDRAEPSARESCWFIWAKATRRLITALQEENQADINNLGIIGIKQGAIIMWQVAAMDGRIKAASSIVGSESMLYRGKSKFLPVDETELDESRVNWRAAISSEAYARFLPCPLIIAAATNNPESDYDRLEDIINLVPENTPLTLLTCPRQDYQITEGALTTIRKWFGNYLKKPCFFPAQPKITFEIFEGKAIFNIIVDESKKIRDVKLYYSYGETDPAFRNWISLDAEKKHDSYSVSPDVFDESIRHYFFAVITYQDNLEISTPEVYFIPQEQGIEAVHAVKQRIIYDAAKGTDTFAAASNSIIVKEENPGIIKSAAGINGIRVTEGELFTYKIGDMRLLRVDDAILQLDANSETDTNIIITLTALDEGEIKKYSTTIAIKGSLEWKKYSFSSLDFKTEEFLPLKSWQNVKKLEISAENVLFNNIIWV
jgi:hypothetical protein